MRKLTTLAAAALAAAFALSLAAGSASAITRIQTDTTSFSTSGRLTLGAPGIPNIFCDTTFYITTRRLIAKVMGAEAGRINEANITNCGVAGGGGAAVEALLPLTIAYGSIVGSLPSITGALFLVSGGFLISATVLGLTVRCLFMGTIGASANENPMRTLGVLEEEIPLITDLESQIACPESGSLSGTEVVNGTSIRLSLLEG